MRNGAPFVLFDLRPLQCGYKDRGIGRYTRELLRALRERLRGNPARYRLEGLAFAEKDPPGEIPIVLTAPRSERSWLWDQGVLLFHLRRIQADLFHSCAAMGPLKEVNFPVPFASRSILTVHDWNLYADDASPLERFYRSTRRLRFQKRFLRRAAQVVVDSACVADETAVRAGVAPEMISLISPGGDHLDAVAEKSPEGTGFVLSIGDGPHKGIDIAFHALTRARELGFNRDWIVIGDPNRLRTLLKFSGSLPPWMRVLPSVTDAELKGLYRAALCLLFPSRHEGFGFPALEAMRLGCPVLALDKEPLRSVIGVTESLLPTEDAAGFARALLRLDAEPEFRAGFSAQGISRAGDHTWKKTADQVLALWDRLSAP